MKKIPGMLLSIFVIISMCNMAYGEFVFKKDGSIIKGKIVLDEPATISVKKEDNTIEKVGRSEIMRIIYTDLYLGKVYVRLTTGEIIEGFLVDEDRDSYYVRRDVSKPEEIVLARNKVMFISRTNPTDVRATASTDTINVSWSPPFKPAKRYRVYIRDVMGKQEKFRMEGETSDLTYVFKNLQKSWVYEIYATAIASTGEESLPSEKVMANTLPEAPEKLVITENPAGDNKHVNLTLNWLKVTDPQSRVKSYAIYEIIDEGRKKMGTSVTGDFLIKNFPAEGRHRFAVVAVNDIETESDEIRGVYDAGYKIYLKGMISYVSPMGTMGQMASYGYGALVDFGISGKKFYLGIETGCITFKYAEDIKSMMMVPLLFEAGYKLPLFDNFSIRPVLKAGFSYDMIQYVVHDTSDPLITSVATKNNFDPMVSGGIYLQYEIMERVDVFGGAEYSMIFQKSGNMSFINVLCGASYLF